jgi:hypothetical protein
MLEDTFISTQYAEHQWYLDTNRQKNGTCVRASRARTWASGAFAGCWTCGGSNRRPGRRRRPRAGASAAPARAASLHTAREGSKCACPVKLLSPRFMAPTPTARRCPPSRSCSKAGDGLLQHQCAPHICRRCLSVNMQTSTCIHRHTLANTSGPSSRA